MIAGSFLPGCWHGEAGESPMPEDTRREPVNWCWTTACALVALLGFAVLFPVATPAAVLSTGGTFKVEWFVDGDDAMPDVFQVSVEGQQITFSDATPGAVFERNENLSTACSNVDAATITCDTAVDPNLNGSTSPASLKGSLGAGDSFDPGAPGCDDGPYESEVFAGGGATVFGTKAGDAISVTNGSMVHGCGGGDQIDAVSKNKLFGDGGDDLINAGWGNSPPPRKAIGDHDLAVGGGGRDEIWVGARGKAIGGPGLDVLGDGRGQSLLKGGPGPDELTSGPGHDLLLGGRGQDHLFAGSRHRKISFFVQRVIPTQSDRLRCGPGRDQVEAGHNSHLLRCERKRWLPYEFSTR